MGSVGQVGVVLILVVFAATYNGFRRQEFFNQYKFAVDRILLDRDYKRMLTSGFLHVSWMHVLFNMFALMSFSGSVESLLGGGLFAIIYFGSLFGGNLLALYIHRNHVGYTAVGASGAVSGIIFASIALFPDIEIGIPFIEYYLESWIFAILFVSITIYGIKMDQDNIGHEAHLGGALVGMLIAIISRPECLTSNVIPIALLTVPTLVFIIVIVVNPHWLVIKGYRKKPTDNAYTIEHRYNEGQKAKSLELDAILDKIHQKGIHSLTKKERAYLEKHSGRG